ncbi:hypothetical protein KJA15_04010 [Patescibacteria group bacterium]|nr:hypothetical protein [Patescibacteria group bacterium]
MFLKIPIDKIQWTKHVQEKMKFYKLSKSRLRRLLLNPKRIEKGIVPRTIAIMQPTGSKKRPTEIWLMYQKVGKKIRIITAWRYPGISPIREEIPIPEDILKDLWKLKI